MEKFVSYTGQTPQAMETSTAEAVAVRPTISSGMWDMDAGCGEGKADNG